MSYDELMDFWRNLDALKIEKLPKTKQYYFFDELVRLYMFYYKNVTN